MFHIVFERHIEKNIVIFCNCFVTDFKCLGYPNMNVRKNKKICVPRHCDNSYNCPYPYTCSENTGECVLDSKTNKKCHGLPTKCCLRLHGLCCSSFGMFLFGKIKQGILHMRRFFFKREQTTDVTQTFFQIVRNIISPKSVFINSNLNQVHAEDVFSS